MNKHFEGVMQNYIECINVAAKSEREEPFQDVQLNVKGCSNIYASFDAYCEAEMMDGQNQYSAEGHGLQACFQIAAQCEGLQQHLCQLCCLLQGRDDGRAEPVQCRGPRPAGMLSDCSSM